MTFSSTLLPRRAPLFQGRHFGWDVLLSPTSRSFKSKFIKCNGIQRYYYGSTIQKVSTGNWTGASSLRISAFDTIRRNTLVGGVGGRKRFSVQATTDSASSSNVEITHTKSSSPPQMWPSSGVRPKDDQMEDEYTMQLQNLVRHMYHTADYEKGLEASLELLRHCQSHFKHPSLPGQHPVTASAHNNVALMYKCMGKFPESEEHYELALEMYKSTLGADHANSATAMANLANLLRARVHHDNNQSLNVRQRREMLTKSVSLLEKSLTIRETELGKDHPHTVTSRSNLGATLAAQILLDTHNSGNDSNVRALKNIDPNSKLHHAEKQRLKLSKKQHELAEHYLRSALRLALQNQDAKPSNKNQNGNSKQHPRRRKQKQNAVQKNNGVIEFTTLSSASAAQSLAVYLKTTADWLTKLSPTASSIAKDVISGSSGGSAAAAVNSENPMELYSEAQWLYESVLKTRRRILGEINPDTIATMSSLAELKASVGDEDGSVKLRQEIMKLIESSSGGGES